MPPRPRQRRSLSGAEQEQEGDEAKTLSISSEKPGHKRRAEMAPDSEISAKLDSQVLDCTICSEPLCPPIYQCEVGHVLCFLCRRKLCSNKCPICKKVFGYNRCFALEQMIDAVKVPCSNSIFGCNVYSTYYQKKKHEKTCMHAACFCPEDGCSFEGSTGLLLNHFVTKHKWFPTTFNYGKPQRISIPRYSRFVLLVGEDQSLFLLVVNTFAHIGNAITTVCIRPHESGSCYSSKISAVNHLEAHNGRYIFQMDPHVASSSLHGGVQLGRFFLLVPPDLVDESTDQLTINIHIEKIKCAVHH